LNIDVPVGRVYSNDWTWNGVVIHSDGTTIQILRPKTFEVLASMPQASATFICGRNQCGDPNTLARWRVEGPDGARWLVEHVTGCGCSGSAQGEAAPALLAW
jgi:hypothetical protein